MASLLKRARTDLMEHEVDFKIALGQVGLGTIIAFLKDAAEKNPDRVIKKGFANPYSYRGYYEQLAFEPVSDIKVSDMLKAAESAVDTTYTGYKGGEYTMSDYTKCWIAFYGCEGETIGMLLLELLLKED
jgi:hypothetical protein